MNLEELVVLASQSAKQHKEYINNQVEWIIQNSFKDINKIYDGKGNYEAYFSVSPEFLPMKWAREKITEEVRSILEKTGWKLIFLKFSSFFSWKIGIKFTRLLVNKKIEHPYR